MRQHHRSRTPYLFSYGEPPFYEKCGSGDKSRFIACKIKGGCSNFLGCPHSAEGLCGGHFTVGLFGVWIFGDPIFHERRFDAPWTDPVGAYSIECMIEGEALRKTHHGKLGRTVSDSFPYAVYAADRGHIHDNSVFALDHPRNKALRKLEHAAHVYSKEPFQIARGCPFDRADVADSRVVYEDIQPAVLAVDVGYDAHTVLGFSDIKLQERRLAGNICDLFRNAPAVHFVNNGYVNKGPFVGKSIGDGLANSRSAAGYKRNFSGKIEHYYVAILPGRENATFSSTMPRLNGRHSAIPLSRLFRP